MQRGHGSEEHEGSSTETPNSQQPTANSQRIAALERALAAGEAGALADFWREMAERGTPLVEPVDDEPGRRLALTRDGMLLANDVMSVFIGGTVR